MNQICDEVLNACLTRLPQTTAYFSLKQLCISRGALPPEADGALIFLLKEHIVKSGEIFVLTPYGEAFAKAGGFAGQNERAEKEEARKRDEAERARLVSQSILDTNESVRRTHAFQRRTTWLTIFVAATAVAISVISLFKSNNEAQIEHLIRRQMQLQEQLDSLQMTAKPRISPDSLR
jgi:hypothetical protein